ncbi:MAG TPA: helix-turn-helix transcriptional regulator [Thermoanaerobaculia bacterium]|nr:helix-turn-helix transcriptional regulator [Thermoanaerobaculia bacterium]
MGKLVAELMKEIRTAEKSGMTRYQIANKAGISHANISRLMGGERVTITVDTLEKVCEALSIQISLRRKSRR